MDSSQNPRSSHASFCHYPYSKFITPGVRFFLFLKLQVIGNIICTHRVHTLCTLLGLASVAQHYVCELYSYCGHIIFIIWISPVWSSSRGNLSRHVSRHVWWAGVSCPRLVALLRVFLIPPDQQANLDVFSWHPQNTGGEMPAHPSFHLCHIC